MFPSAKAKALQKEQERQRQIKLAEEKKQLHIKIASIIEEDDLDSLKEYVPSKMPIDELIDEFLLLFIFFVYSNSSHFIMERIENDSSPCRCRFRK